MKPVTKADGTPVKVYELLPKLVDGAVQTTPKGNLRMDVRIYARVDPNDGHLWGSVEPLDGSGHLTSSVGEEGIPLNSPDAVQRYLAAIVDELFARHPDT